MDYHLEFVYEGGIIRRIIIRRVIYDNPFNNNKIIVITDNDTRILIKRTVNNINVDIDIIQIFLN